MNVLQYIRVSSDEQGKKGASLESQRVTLDRVCTEKGWNVVKRFEDVKSAKGFNRNAWQQLLAYCKQNRSTIDMVCVKDYDRFSRGTLLEQLQEMQNLIVLGVQVYAVKLPIDTDDPNGMMVRDINLVLSNWDNQNRKKKTMEVLQYLREQGYWCSSPPVGYIRAWTDGAKPRPTLAPDPESASIINEAFEQYMKWGNQQEVRRWLAEQGINVLRSKIEWLLTNPVYIGLVTRRNRKTGKVVETYKGKHEGIVPELLWNEVQAKISGNQKSMMPKRDDAFPLKGLVVCPHGELMTVSRTHKKKTGARYQHYECRQHCGRKAKDIKHRAWDVRLDEWIVKELGKLVMPEDVVNLYYDMLRLRMDKMQGQMGKHIHKAKQDVERLEKKLDKLKQQWMDDELTIELYQELRVAVEGKLVHARIAKGEAEQLGGVGVALHDPRNGWINNLATTYASGGIEVKRLILSSVWPEKLVISKKGLPNQPMNMALLMIASVGKGLRLQKKNGNSQKTRIPIEGD